MTSVITIIGILIMMLSISWQITIVAVLILPISFGLIRLMIGKSQGYFDQQKALGQLNGHVEEMFSGPHRDEGLWRGESFDRQVPGHQ